MLKVRENLRREAARAACLAEREEAVIAVESRYHAKNNGVSPKDQMSRGNKIRVFLILLAVIGFGISVNAQDIILKKDGSEIKAKVLEITDQQIKYKDFDFIDGPIRNINISEVFLIIYENGKREVFNKTEVKKTSTETKETSVKAKENSVSKNEPSGFSVCGVWVDYSDAPDRMTWEEAKQKAPQGYRLPTPNELKCMRTSLRETKGRLQAREYWTNEDAIHDKAYSVTMDDGKTEKNKRSEKLFVRYVKAGGYEDAVNVSQQTQTESYRDVSNDETPSYNEANSQGFVMSKKAEIIVDSYALMDGAGAVNYIIKNLEELGFCCVKREEFKNNNTATISIAVANGFPATVRIIVMDRTRDVQVWNTTYTNWSFGYKFLQKFIKDMKPFISE